MDTTALMQSLVLMLVGMLVVFIFMGLLIVVVKLFLFMAFRFFPDAEDKKTVSVAPNSVNPDENVVAAIASVLMEKK